MKDVASSRVKSLDGIRGLSILAVLLNHIAPVYVLKILPVFLYPLSSFIFASGVLGVSFLFVLSGFLMAYIYPQPRSGLWFLQKRYTRIFPLFLTLSIVMLLFSVFPMLLSLWGFLVILSLAVVVHFIWVYFVKKMPPKFGKGLFILFLFIQLFAAFVYVFFIMRHSPIVFNQQIPSFLREGTIGLVNSTLTLPLGNYIPMLDGVYWSLAAEVLFYILYPIFCVPVINFLTTQRRIIKYAFLLALIPLIIGIDLLSRKTLGLSMLQFPLFYCFVTGMTLGYLYKRKPQIIYKVTGIFKGKMTLLSVVFFIAVIYFYHFALDKQTPFNSLTHILFAIPLTLVIAVALDQRNVLSKIFSSKILVFLGLISYSVYLSHTAVIHIFEAIFKPTSTMQTLIFLALIITTSIILARILYQLLEKPYFLRPKEAKLPMVNNQTASFTKPAFLALVTMCIIYLLATFNAYQSTFNFFSTEYPSGQNAFVSPKITNNQTFISMYNHPIVNMKIQSQENNFGIITMHLKEETITGALYNSKQNNLTFRIKEEGASNWYAVNSYKFGTIGDSSNHPFGFPAISNSKGKTYDIQLQLFEANYAENILIDTTASSIKNVYPVSKSQLIKSPSRFIVFLEKRIANVFLSHEAQEVLFLLIPFFVLSFFVFIPKKIKFSKIRL